MDLPSKPPNANQMMSDSLCAVSMDKKSEMELETVDSVLKQQGEHMDTASEDLVFEEAICSLARERIRCTEGISCLHDALLKKRLPVEETIDKNEDNAEVCLKSEEFDSIRHRFEVVQAMIVGLRKDIPELIGQCKRLCEISDQNANMLQSNTDQILFSIKRPTTRRQRRLSGMKVGQRNLSQSLQLPLEVTPTPRKRSHLSSSQNSLNDSMSRMRTRSADRPRRSRSAVAGKS